MFDKLVQEILAVANADQQQAYSDAVNTLAAYFNGEDEVRCFVTNTNGFGHQISTVNMLKRLISYGYSNTITLIYDDTGQPDMPTIQKLKILLPEISIPPGGGNPAPIQLDGCTVAFAGSGNYNPASTADFGFTGGYDDSNNLAATLDTNYFLVLQPFQWGQAHFGNSILRKDAATIALDTLPALQPRFKDRAFYMPNPTLTDAQWDLYLNHVTGAESANMICEFATEFKPDDVNINLCTAYGMSNVGGLNTLATSAENILFSLTCGIIQYLDNAAFTSRKPTVLLVLANVTHTSYTELQNYFNGNNYNNNVNTNQFLQSKNVANRVKFQLNGSDSHTLLKNIDDLEDNEILIVSLPGLPPDIFNQMIYAANIPIVFEGKNTANLAINFPKSFFWLATNGSGVVYPTLPLGSPAGGSATANQASANSMQLGPRWWPSLNGTPNNPAEILGEFISNSNPINPPTNFTDYFTQLSNFYHSQINDKLFMAMQQAFIPIRNL